MGGSEIFKIASDNKRRAPNIDTNLMTTELTIWKVDIAELPDLSDREKTVLRYIANAGRAVTSKELLEQLPQCELPTLKKSGLPASAPAACSGKPTQVLR